MAVSALAIRSTISWEDLKGVSWGIFLIIGAGLSLGETLSRNGVTEWFSSLIGPLVSGPPFLVSLLLLVLILLKTALDIALHLQERRRAAAA